MRTGITHFAAMGRLLSTLALTMLLAACASGITSTTKKLVDYKGPFDALAKHPDGFNGRVVLVGGRILEVNAGPSFSEVVVLQHPLDGSSDRPRAEKGSSGRFIIQSGEFLDPEVYRRSYLVTVAGTVVGKAEKQVGAHAMTLPRIEVLESKLWVPSSGVDRRPAVSFGVGVGSGGSDGGVGVGVGTWF